MLGTLNPLPFTVGGGPTPSSLAYDALRKAVGEGGSAKDDRGIEGLWRRSEAKGLAAGASHCRRALIQSNPLFATDLLPYYERMLGIIPDPAAAEAQRRDVVVPLWTKRAEGATPKLKERLTALDSRLTIFEEVHDHEATAQYGRAFAPLEPGLEQPAWGLVQGHVACPGYSSDMIVRVLFKVGHDGPLTADELRVVESCKVLLRDMLQSSTDFQIAVDSGTGVPGQWHVGVTPIGFGAVN